MEILKDIGIGLGFILILAFAVFFAMLSVMFIFGLPSLYFKYLERIGKRIESKFPRLARNKNYQGITIIFAVVSVSLVLVGAIFLWGAFFEWLPR